MASPVPPIATRILPITGEMSACGQRGSIMKIFCVGMNYAEHNKELNHSIGEIEGITLPANCKPSSPSTGEVPPCGAEGVCIFLKPDTALCRSDWPVYVPDFTNEFEYETELVVKICRLGKSIPARFAHRYYEEVTVGIDFTARDLQRQLKAKGLPWEISKGFDSSAFCGEWVKLSDLAHPYGVPSLNTESQGGSIIQDLHFEMQLNGETRQVGYTGDMLHAVDEIIEYISRFYILKTGDLIFTGTPSGVGKLKEGDVITATLEGKPVLECRIK